VTSVSFRQGHDLGHCASNPSPECAQGTPLAPKELVLTFDDGPGDRTTELSSWLAARGIRATFFMRGDYASGNVSLMAQLAGDGHLIGNHTFDHLDLTTLRANQIVDEVATADAILSPWVDAGHFLFRAPYGRWSAADYDALAASPMRKYAGPVRWDIGGELTARYAADWDCWAHAMTSEECGDRYIAQIHDVGRGIVLMHDQDYGTPRGNTVDMVEYVVPMLEEEGYAFLRADEVPDIRAPKR
jgi:peptidoglycan/xylan/chitin deacetylase (PgdA/CDA1 family)